MEGQINPAVLISISDATATEGTDATMDFVVSLSPATSGTVTVKYSTVDVTAESPSDYQGRTGTLTFQPGETSKIISIPIVDDAVNDSGETFEVLLHDAKGADTDVALATGTIINAEPVDISVNSPTATEGVDETMEFVVTLTRPTTETLIVDYTTFDGTATAGLDYTETFGTLSFEPGETSKIISVPIINDDVNDDGETFNLLVTRVADARYIITNGSGVGTIRNTEILTGSFRNVPQDHDGSNTFTFNVNFTLDISITPAAMRDHAFTVSNGEVTAAARVNGRDDRWLITVEPDGNDAVTITLPGDRDCTTQGAICSDEDNPVQLSNSPSATVAVIEGTPLTASFANVPDEHTGADFTFDLAFTDELAAGFEKIKAAFQVSGGSINRVNRKTKGKRPGVESQGPAGRHRFADDHVAGNCAMQLLGRDLHR